MRDRKILNLLFKLAEDQPSAGGVKMSAAIVLKGDFVSFGFNTNKTHPLQKRFAGEDKIFLHAEMDAIWRAIRRISYKQLTRATLYVCRMKYDSLDHEKINARWGMSKPCGACQRAIVSYGIKKVLYTEEGNGNFRRL